MNRAQTFCLTGAVALLLGLFLPWATVTSATLGVARTMSGYQGDSIIAGGIGLVLLIVAISRKGEPGKRYSVVAIVLAIVAGLVAIIYLQNPADAADRAKGIIITTGLGPYLSLVGSVLAFFGGIQTVPGSPAPSSAPSASPPDDRRSA